MNRVCVGIPVRERADFLAASVRCLRAFTPAGSSQLQIIALADGPDAATRCALVNVGADQLITWDGSFGDPYCFNRMVTECAADLYVLLENGARVSPHWLDRLIHALAADETHGIAGPSTNRAWNEQQVFTDCRGDEAELARIGNAAAERFGDAFAYLEPLHSLGDFCYAVSRKVVDRIGAADEGYGEGPCWEMDYNIRAARAGFRGVWAKSAFVWRAPATSRRRTAEARRFALSKRRYQDNFCALRLRKETTRYDVHCTGEACPHFAPPELIVTRREFASRLPASSPTVVASDPTIAAPPPATVERLRAERPLVSCIMPTANRRHFVPQAIAAFLRQDYEPRELVIIDDGTDCVEDLIPRDDRIRYIRNPHRTSLGNKRNEACRVARGEIIVHWDDDDWHAHWRLSYQVTELLARQADICGLDKVWFYDADAKRAWQYRYPGGRSRWLAGGTFCYRKSLWERQRFGDVPVGEDTRFVREATFASILALDRDDFYVARIHAGNTCRKQASGASWHAVPAGAIEALTADTNANPPASQSDRSQLAGPLVSCIMPTCDRREFLSLAIKLFQRQSYSSRELIVIDDGRDSVRDLIPADDRIRYARMNRAMTLGEKRNLACEMSAGEFVVHWDDDDWYGPERLTAQVTPLEQGRADVTALAMSFVLDLADMRFWRCRPSHHARIHHRDLCPGTLAFSRRLWLRGARYAAVRCAEDVAFLRSLPPSARIVRLSEECHFICIRHAFNTWSMQLDWRRSPSGWEPSDRPAFMGTDDLGVYQQASRRLNPGGTARRDASPHPQPQGAPMRA